VKKKRFGAQPPPAAEFDYGFARSQKTQLCLCFLAKYQIPAWLQAYFGLLINCWDKWMLLAQRALQLPLLATGVPGQARFWLAWGGISAILAI
jgi:hypothetical protein